MKFSIKKSIAFLTVMFFLPFSAHAFSGAGDRMMDEMINLVAIGAVILLVQLVLWLIFRRKLKDCNYTRKLMAKGESICARKYGSLFTFWILFSFVGAPYLGIPGVLTMGAFWLLLIPLALILLFTKNWRERILTPANYRRLVNLSLAEIIGLGSYGLVCRTSVIQKAFFYDWGEVPELGFISCADESAFGHFLAAFIHVALLLFVAVVIYLLVDALLGFFRHKSK